MWIGPKFSLFEFHDLMDHQSSWRKEMRNRKKITNLDLEFNNDGPTHTHRYIWRDCTINYIYGFGEWMTRTSCCCCCCCWNEWSIISRKLSLSNAPFLVVDKYTKKRHTTIRSLRTTWIHRNRSKTSTSNKNESVEKKFSRAFSRTHTHTHTHI